MNNIATTEHEKSAITLTTVIYAVMTQKLSEGACCVRFYDNLKNTGLIRKITGKSGLFYLR
jgi:hypothetical protein